MQARQHVLDRFFHLLARGVGERRAVAQKSNGVIGTFGNRIQWVHSYVVDDKIYCVYHADLPKSLEEHAKCGGFPANRISRVRAIMDPTTAEA